MADEKVLKDSGATANFLDQRVAVTVLASHCSLLLMNVFYDTILEVPALVAHDREYQLHKSGLPLSSKW